MPNCLLYAVAVTKRETMTHYRLYNHVTGAIIYLLSIIDDQEVDHQERLEKKKVQIGYEKGIDYNDMSWESLFHSHCI